MTGGRAGDPPAATLAARLREGPFVVDRLKTGTPPRIDGRSIDYSRLAEQAGEVPVPAFSYVAHGDARPRQVSCWITYTSERHARHHPRRPGSLADVLRRDRGRRSALLPLDRGQGGALRRQGLAPDLPGARGPGHLRGLPERHLHLAALRSAAGAGALDPGPRERAPDPPGLRDRVRLLRPARPEGLAGNQGGGRVVLRRPDQRHHRLRGSGGAGPDGRRQRRAGRARARTLRCRAATRPTSAC